jgi:hypothetical protein
MPGQVSGRQIISGAVCPSILPTVLLRIDLIKAVVTTTTPRGNGKGRATTTTTRGGYECCASDLRWRRPVDRSIKSAIKQTKKQAAVCFRRLLPITPHGRESRPWLDSNRQHVPPETDAVCYLLVIQNVWYLNCGISRQPRPDELRFSIPLARVVAPTIQGADWSKPDGSASSTACVFW